MAAARVPPKTIRTEFKLKNQYKSPPPLNTPIAIIPTPANRPIIVPKSMYAPYTLKKE
jgi:hypothetical protein